MPFQDRYQKLKQGAESYFASSIIEEDLERKIDTITTYKKSYIKSIFTRMAHANPHNANILHDYIVAQKMNRISRNPPLRG